MVLRQSLLSSTVRPAKTSKILVRERRGGGGGGGGGVGGGGGGEKVGGGLKGYPATVAGPPGQEENQRRNLK